MNDAYLRGYRNGYIEKQAGAKARGVRDGTGPFVGSAQHSLTGSVGRRRLAGETCPASEEEAGAQELADFIKSTKEDEAKAKKRKKKDEEGDIEKQAGGVDKALRALVNLFVRPARLRGAANAAAAADTADWVGYGGGRALKILGRGAHSLATAPRWGNVALAAAPASALALGYNPATMSDRVANIMLRLKGIEPPATPTEEGGQVLRLPERTLTGLAGF